MMDELRSIYILHDSILQPILIFLYSIVQEGCYVGKFGKIGEIGGFQCNGGALRLEGSGQPLGGVVQ